MKATILQSHHVVQIDNTQIDLFYFFTTNNIQIYMEGQLYISVQFNPARTILSYTNILDVTSYYYERWIKEQNRIAKLNELT